MTSNGGQHGSGGNVQGTGHPFGSPRVLTQSQEECSVYFPKGHFQKSWEIVLRVAFLEQKKVFEIHTYKKVGGKIGTMRIMQTPGKVY